MKKIICKVFAMVAIAATVFSFTTNSPAGGEGFEIYVNGKVSLQRFGKEVNNITTLQLNPAQPNDKISIRYYHCGQAGKNRYVTIKNAENSPLKVWRYKDASETVSDMSCTVNDLLALQKNRNGGLKIFYSSSLLPLGRQLADVVFGDTVKK